MVERFALLVRAKSRRPRYRPASHVRRGLSSETLHGQRAPGSPNPVRHVDGFRPVVLAEDVRIRVERHCWGVAELLGELDDRGALLADEQRGERVPQVVGARTPRRSSGTRRPAARRRRAGRRSAVRAACPPKSAQDDTWPPPKRRARTREDPCSGPSAEGPPPRRTTESHDLQGLPEEPTGGLEPRPLHYEAVRVSFRVASVARKSLQAGRFVRLGMTAE